MIKNKLQYRVAKANLKKFKATLRAHDSLTAHQSAWVREAHNATISGEVAELEVKIREYERTKSGEAPPPALDVLNELPSMLIKNRIALGWTHEDLAKRLGVRPQQVQNDEATDYESASLSRLRKIAEILQKARGRRKSKQA